MKNAKRWDFENGVWHEGSQASNEFESIPSPLYIFGYGSLLWRPGDILGKFPHFSCICYGWNRLFAQRSQDHRGTVSFPGMVVTLIEDDHLISEQMKSNISEPGECVGLSYLIPKDEVQNVISELDYRERGGYNRHLIPVRFLEDTPHHVMGSIAHALVYTGSSDNPNYQLTKNIINIAGIIAAATGPSGSNAEYLFQLHEFVQRRGQVDHHLSILEKEVRLLQGTRYSFSQQKTIHNELLSFPSAARSVISYINPSHFLDLLPTHFTSISTMRGGRQSGTSLSFLGWGCNSHQQLNPLLPPLEINHALQVNDLQSSKFQTNQHLIEQDNGQNENSTEIFSSDSINNKSSESMQQSSTSSSSHPFSNFNETLSESYSPRLYQLLCGGTHSGLLVADNTRYSCISGSINSSINCGSSSSSSNTDVSERESHSSPANTTTLLLWGNPSSFSLHSERYSDQPGNTLPPSSSTSSSTSTPHHPPPSLPLPLSSSPSLLYVRGIRACSLGFNHSLLLLSNGRILCLGDDSYNQCSGLSRYPWLLASRDMVRDVGPLEGELRQRQRQRTEFPELGSDNHGNGDLKTLETFTFTSQINKKLFVTAIAAGLRHSVAICNGRLLSWGDCRHHQCLQSLQDTEGGQQVGNSTHSLDDDDNDEMAVHWNNITWGPEDGVPLLDVSCGSRHTVLVDAIGRVWTLGDNRYYQLGQSDAMMDVGIPHQPQLVTPLLVKGVRWTHVTCGWSHTVVKGFRSDGSLIFYGWGRQDLGQLGLLISASESTTTTTTTTTTRMNDKKYREPSPLPDLPTGDPIREVWCGGETTIASCHNGYLWATGWNEHGNIGKIDDKNNYHEIMENKKSENQKQGESIIKGGWIPLLDSRGNQVQLDSVWSGSVALSGGHSLTIFRNNS